jgi:hypothetical protein
MPHAPSRWGSLPRNEAYHWFGDVLRNVGCSVFFRGATYFADQHYGIGLGILLKLLKALYKG